MAKPSQSFAGDPALVKIGEVIRQFEKVWHALRFMSGTRMPGKNPGIDVELCVPHAKGEHGIFSPLCVFLSTALSAMAPHR